MRSIMFLIGLTASSFALLGEVRQVLFYKECDIKAVMKRKDSICNCVGVLSDQGEAATASNPSEYTITLSAKKEELRAISKNIGF